MTLKGIIVEQLKAISDNNQILSNRYNVRIPALEAQGTFEKAILECGLIFQPGSNLGYEPNDVVLVNFEHDNLNNGFIIGKIYVDDSSSEYKAESNPFNLKVENNAILPENTTIGGIDIVTIIKNFKNNFDALNNYFLYKHSIKISETTPAALVIADSIYCSQKEAFTSDNLVNYVKRCGGYISCSGYYYTASLYFTCLAITLDQNNKLNVIIHSPLGAISQILLSTLGTFEDTVTVTNMSLS